MVEKAQYWSMTMDKRLSEEAVKDDDDQLRREFLSWTSNQDRKSSGEWKVGKETIIRHLTQNGWKLIDFVPK